MAALIAEHKAAYSNALAKQAEAKATNLAKDSLKKSVTAKARIIAQKCKASNSYTTAIGKELGSIGTELTINLDEVKPEIRRISQQEDKIVFGWIKGNMHGIVVYGAKRSHVNQKPLEQTEPNNGQNLVWEEIGRDFRSPYEDKRRNLGIEPKTRFYKFRYIYKDEIVGVDSNIIKVIAEIITI